MKNAPRLGMNAGSESRFFLYSSCSLLLRSANVSGRAGAVVAGGASITACPVSKSIASSSAALSETFKPFIIISMSRVAVDLVSERAMGGEGAFRLMASAGALTSRAPLTFRLGFPGVNDGVLSASLRSLLSASASSSMSEGTEISLWESSACSVATERLSSPSSSSRLRRGKPERFLGAAMMDVQECGGRYSLGELQGQFVTGSRQPVVWGNGGGGGGGR